MSLSTVRVLIAEPDDGLALRLQRFLEGLDFDVERVSNGSRAADRALNDKFDLLLLALDLPIFGGEEVLSLCRRHSNCPAIALSDDPDCSQGANGFAATINRRVLDFDQVESTVRWVLS